MGKIRSVFSKIRKVLTDREVRRNVILLLTAPVFPRLHLRLRIKYGHYTPENPIDLKHPRLFNEKLFWLQYYITTKACSSSSATINTLCAALWNSRAAEIRLTRYTAYGTI